MIVPKNLLPRLFLFPTHHIIGCITQNKRHFHSMFVSNKYSFPNSSLSSPLKILTPNRNGLNYVSRRYRYYDPKEKDKPYTKHASHWAWSKHVQYLIKKNKVSEALEYFRTHTTLTGAKSLLSAYKKEDSREAMEKGLDLFFILFESHLLADTLFLTLLMTLCNKWKPSETLKLFSYMEAYSIEIDFLSFSNITWAAWRERDHNVMKKLMEIIIQGVKFEVPQNCLKLMLAVFANRLYYKNAVTVMNFMIKNNIPPDFGCYVYLVVACTGTGAQESGKLVHEQIKKTEYHTKEYILQLLAEMYLKHNNVEQSIQIFSQIPNPSRLLWNKMITLCARIRDSPTALDLFEKLQNTQLKPDKITYTSVLTAISLKGPPALQEGKKIHQQITQQNISFNTPLATALLRMYASCGEPYTSIELFTQIFENNNYNNPEPNEYTFTNLFHAISEIGPSGLEIGKTIHQKMIQQKFDTNPVVILALIQMYNKCGEPITSVNVFMKLIESSSVKTDDNLFNNVLSAVSEIGPSALEIGKKIHQLMPADVNNTNIILTNKLIQMYEKCGDPSTSLQIYDQMVYITPNWITYCNTLNAISKIGPNALEKGKKVHQKIIRDKLDEDPNVIKALENMYNKCRTNHLNDE